MNENYDYSYGHVSLIETHDPSIHVYPNYIFIKIEKGYNNYKLSYTCNGLYKDNDDYSFSNEFYGFFDIYVPDLYNY